MISVRPWQLAIIVTALTFLSQCHAAELIRNGNFEKGNRDFRSDYPEGLGSYLVTRNLRNFHQKQSGNIGLFGDHTSGRGHMMAVDGATIAGKVVWEQTVKVLPNQEYNFSMYIASWYQVSPAILEVIINGREMDSVEASSKLGEWKRLSFKWQSESDTTAVIAIRNRNTNGDGNDFVIDDISLQGPRPFPPQVDALLDKYEKDATAIRDKARVDTDKHRKKLLADLQILLDVLTKEGELDEALVLRQHIESITEEFEAEQDP
jgi:hypothetical protein